MVQFNCKTCSSEIVDESEESVWCDSCQNWVHSKKECSGIKKTLFKVLGKNDTYTCPSCAVEIKKFNAEIGLSVDQVKKDLIEAKQIIEELEAKNKQLTQDLNVKEVKLIALIERLEGRMDGECGWSAVKPDKCARGVGLDSISKFPPLSTSNSFGVLGGMELKESKPKGANSTRGAKVIEKFRGGNRPKRSRKPKKGKNVIFVADSQGRNCGGIMHEELAGSEWGAQALVNPSATNEQVVDVALSRVRNLGSNDCLVILGGVNSVTTESINKIDTKLDKLSAELKAHQAPPSIVVMETPYRYDTGRYNNIISAQNKLLKGKCTSLGWTYLATNSLLSRSCYTKHGLHLNQTGKEILVSLVVSLTQNFSGPKSTEKEVKNDLSSLENEKT